MIEKIWDSPEIYSIPVNLPQNPLQTLNCYVIRGKDQDLIIDTGFNRSECREALWGGLDELDLDLSRASLFLTHLHSDHTGLVWDFVSRGVPAYMGRIDHTYSAGVYRDHTNILMEQLYECEGYPIGQLALQEMKNQGRVYSPHRLYPVIPLEDGDSISLGDVELIAIHTPGHTPGHMVLYLPEEQILFSGDHILFDITPNIGVWHNVPRSLSDYIDSLQKIRALPIRTTFPAHRAGGSDAYARIDQIIEHHGQRLDEIYQVVKANRGITAYTVASRITWSGRSGD